MDWHHSYMEHQRMVVKQIRDARASGEPILPLASRVVHPQELSERDITDIALRDAEHVINMAIAQHNAEIERRAK